MYSQYTYFIILFLFFLLGYIFFFYKNCYLCDILALSVNPADNLLGNLLAIKTPISCPIYQYFL